MERLTEKHYLAEDHYMKCSGNCHGDIDCIDCPAFDRLVERLAAYEDTGVTPEEIKSAFTPDALIKLAAQALGTTPERLRELAAADKDGRVVVLPPENYDWKIRGDIALGIIAANCRRAEAERAMQEMRASNGRT